MTQTTNSNAPKSVKAKGPIRWGAIVPFSVFAILFIGYFHFFFDMNMRSALEWGATKAVGAEVNIKNFETSFFNASLKVDGIEITDSERPTHDSISIGQIRFGMLWDALLRAKFVINEAVVEQIEFSKKRSSPGLVLPPPPPEPKEAGPSVVSEQADKLKKAALSETKAKYNDNVLGDVAAMLGGAKSDVQLDQLKNNMASKQLADKLEQDLKSKQKVWDEKIKALPQGKEFQALGDRLGKVKTSNFKSPQELADSLKEIDAILKEGDANYKKIQGAKTELDSDLNSTQEAYKNLEAQIKSDIKDLEKHFKIPQIDAKSLTFSLFKKYLDPYQEKFGRYAPLIKKYFPPNVMKKDKPEEVDVSMKPHPREKGITYEFGRPNSYPLIWIKKTEVTSQAGASPESGNIKGQILDVTTQQNLTGKPTVANLEGDFPGLGISGFQTKITYDNRQAISLLNILFKVSSYEVANKPLVQSEDVGISITKAKGSVDLNADLKGFKDLNLNILNKFDSVTYDIQAKDKNVQDIIKNVFTGLPSIYVQAKASGLIPDIPFDIESNAGNELQKGFEKQIQAKIDEARKKIQAFVDSHIGEQKTKIDSQINQFKGQVEKELNKVKDQAEAQKKQAESKTDQAKKDSENQAKKQLQNQGQKALDDLKKKLGF